MSFSIKGRVNVGAYDRPFSGVGVEFDPLGVRPDRSGITLHESGYLPANTDWNFPSVFSPFWRLYHNEQRGHCVVFGERVVELAPSHIMLIPPRVLFHCLGANPVGSFWLTFSFTSKLHPAVAVPVLLTPRDTELCLIRDLKLMIAADETWEPTDAIYRNSLALLQVVLPRRELRWQPPVPENLERVRSHIEDHFGSVLTNSQLARLAGLSEAAFNRAFKQHFGNTPARFVTETRVREAARLLLQTDQTIDEIAEQTGFPNRAYFSRVFKKVTDESPAEFRRKHGQRISRA
ncbi:MAG: AraC family transcriptional regulator [Verrucomicrobiae bacterium]|nr:AraC family transcriptional regulator [Verrucomicrobiae bacterium]